MADGDEDCDQVEQENELSALTSIYDLDTFQPYDETANQLGGILYAMVNIPPSFQVIVERSQDQVQTYAISYLPAICLEFTLPKCYPSLRPPTFTISCCWLNKFQLSLLCEHLDQIWEDNTGCVVLFDWFQFLTDEAIDKLGILQSVCLHLKSKKSATTSQEEDLSDPVRVVDPRVVQEIPSLNMIMERIITFNEQTIDRNFINGYHACNICFDEKSGADCVQLQPCQHVHCKDCVSNYITVMIDDGKVNPIACPSQECSSQILPLMIQRLVSNEYYERYEQLQLRSALETMSDVVYCPRLSCQTAVLVEKNSLLGRCPGCQYAFCIKCQRAYHGVVPCTLSPKDARELCERYMNGNAEERLEMVKLYGEQKLHKVIEQIQSEDWLQKNSKRCPRCRADIEKKDGCNKMHCVICHGNFCWICLQKLDKHRPYIHFSNPSSRCFNKLFDGIDQHDDSDDDDEFW
ncbi:E3 ubiquitin-protein ligase RNF14 [Trichoplax sp. H2]|nr:E3 ubiquitin-protein ligase RNF14 [Trichoplax sp. H2]|eukprot:RDD37547.1 E3 ubiquitin-protein ligase RNF14 [Trichoplax sp. H2]